MGVSEEHIMRKKNQLKGIEGAEEKSMSQTFQQKAISRLDSISRYVNTGLACVAGCSLVLMVLTVVANAVAREISAPYSGTTEIVGWLAAVTTAFGLGYTQVHKGYVDIDALVEKFPLWLQSAIRSIVLFVTMVFFGLVSWQVCLYALNVAANGNLSETMGITFYPLIFLVALGFAGLTLALLVDFLKQVTGGEQS